MSENKEEVTGILVKEKPVVIEHARVLNKGIAKQIRMSRDVTEEILERSKIIGKVASEAIEKGSERLILCKDVENEDYFYIRNTKEIRSYLALELGIERIAQIFIG